MKSQSKKLLVVLGVVVVLVVVIYQLFAGNYNKLVKLEENVETAWSQVQNQYQRRYDLIPNLVETVKGAASHESDVFTQVAEARSNAGGVINVDSSILDDPESFARYQKIQNDLGQSLQRLLMVTENYPSLQANENFLTLQSQIEGCENRIAVERKRYNDSVGEYNTQIRVFPKNIIAGMNGFKAKQRFSAQEEASSAPTVQF